MHAESQTRREGVGRERELARLADRQHGVIARRQLIALGLGRGAIVHRLRLGRLHAVHESVYAVGRSGLTQRGRWMAAVLAYGEGALLSHGSAAVLWGLQGPPPRVSVTARCGRQGIPRRAGIRLHRCKVFDGDATIRDGIPVTSVGRTLFDLAEVVDRSRLERAWEEADRLSLLELAEVEEVCERGRGRRALRPIRSLLSQARAATHVRSPLEDRFATFCRERRLPPAETNVLLLGHEVDAYWPAARLAVELDGFGFHRHRAAFERDRARDADFLAAGYRVVRITERRLDNDADTVATQLRDLLGSDQRPAG